MSVNTYSGGICSRVCDFGNVFSNSDGGHVSKAERVFFSLPARWDSLRVFNPNETADLFYQTSRRATDVIV